MSTGRLDTSTPLSLGELVVPSHVFLVSQVLVPIGPARVLSVTCAARVACLPHSRSGESGRERSTSIKRETLVPLLSPLPLALLLSKLEDTESILSLNFPSL